MATRCDFRSIFSSASLSEFLKKPPASSVLTHSQLSHIRKMSVIPIFASYTEIYPCDIKKKKDIASLMKFWKYLYVFWWSPHHDMPGGCLNMATSRYHPCYFVGFSVKPSSFLGAFCRWRWHHGRYSSLGACDAGLRCLLGSCVHAELRCGKSHGETSEFFIYLNAGSTRNINLNAGKRGLFDLL